MSKRLIVLTLILVMVVGAYAFVKQPDPLRQRSGYIRSGELSVKAKDINKDNLALYYDFAVTEYNNGNYGIARDFFGLVQKIAKDYRSTDIYMGKIYAEIKVFQNDDLAKLRFVRIVNNDKSNSVQKQIAYFELAKLAQSPNEAFNYANSSVVIGDSQNSRQALAIAYGKLFRTTGDEKFVREVVAVLKNPATKIRVDRLLSSKRPR